MTPGSPLVITLVLAAAALLITLMVLHANSIERRAVEAARRLLPDHSRDGIVHRFTGQVHGAEVTLRLYQRSGANETQGGPMAEVLVPQPPGISLELRTQDAVETSRVRKGLARDATTGDPAFDDEFIVEMAPAGLAPTLFDADLRRRLLELRPVEIRPAKEGGLRLVREDWETERFAPLIETGALLATRLRQVAGAEAGQAERWGASHVAERAAERAELDQVRAARTSWTIRNVVLLVVGMLVILVLRLLHS